MKWVTRKTALVLYLVLIVLPTIVLGGLHWHQLQLDQQSLAAAVPGEAEGAAQRLEETLVRRVRELIEREDERPFYEYRENYFAPGTLGNEIALVPSPLAQGPRPHAILGWFTHSARDVVLGTPSQFYVGGHDATEEASALARRTELARAVESMRTYEAATENYFLFLFRAKDVRKASYTVPVVAINVSSENDLECLQEELPSLRGLERVELPIHITDFHLRFYREKDGTPRLLATRNVYVLRDPRLTNMTSCFETLGEGARLVQGFFLDPRWVFDELPVQVAAQVLDTSQEFWGSGVHGEAAPNELFAVHPVEALGCEVRDPEDRLYGTLHVVGSTRDLVARFHAQKLRLAGVVGMLVISLSTGLVLLVRSVKRELESAARTENFVAAVTHELRTPLAAIKLYSEMLVDGWVDSEEKRNDYYRRIVRESARLETLVERVLEKSQLTRNETPAEAGDLNGIVESLVPSLTTLAPEGVDDLAFELADDLPAVMLIPEGVRSIVTNLVENARKYAPVAQGGEPIRVATARAGEDVVLSVEDRGPGIPVAERAKIFEAFYRVGDERTRNTRGTGLGLHLVALQAQAMGAAVSVHGRKGGGTIFQVLFVHADER